MIWWDRAAEDLDVVMLAAMLCDPHWADTLLANPRRDAFAHTQALKICAKHELLDDIATLTGEHIQHRNKLYVGDGVEVVDDPDMFWLMGG